MVNPLLALSFPLGAVVPIKFAITSTENTPLKTTNEPSLLFVIFVVIFFKSDPSNVIENNPPYISYFVSNPSTDSCFIL